MTQSDIRVVEATARAAFTLGAHPIVIRYETRDHAQMEPYPPIEAAVQAADVWIEYAVQYTLYTDARRTACSRGCRYAAFTGMDVYALVRTIGKVNYPVMQAMGEKLVELTRDTKEFRVSTALGTELQCSTQGSNVWQSGRLGDEPGAAVMLGGQTVWLPQESSVNGTVIADGVIWPPDDVGILRQPVTLHIEGGCIKSIEGGAEARILKGWLESLQDSTMMRIAHMNYGYNPGVTSTLSQKFCHPHWQFEI